MKDVRDPQKKI